MKKQDLFITDARLDVIKDFGSDGSVDYVIQNWDDAEFSEIKQFTDELNKEGNNGLSSNS